MITEILDFWFEQLTSRQWFEKSPAIDRELTERFGDWHRKAAAGELYTWREPIEGRLAEVLLLDQFSRNIHRDRPQAFAQDSMALVLAQEAVARGLDEQLPPERRAFLYMPYMHSESEVIHEEAVRLFDQPGLEHNLKFELRHREIIQRFGRYPHRNAILGRPSTAEEIEFLKQPGSGF